MHSKGLALLADCSKQIGSGHVVETLHLSRELKGVSWRAYLGRETPEALVRRFGVRAQRVQDLSPAFLARLAPIFRRQGFSAAVLNGLKIRSAQAQALKRQGLKVACLTTVGARPAGCDLWINLGIGQPRTKNGLGGPEYMVLSEVFTRLSRRRRVHRGPLKNILILMGGTDSSGSTSALVRALAGQLPKVRKHVVAGPNFAHPQALVRALREAGDSSFRLYWAPPRLPFLMRRCDAAFSLGSDTSLELACLGTPTILVHEAPHERVHALYLAKRGCGLFLGSASSVTSQDTVRLLRRMDNPSFRNRCARAGQELVDGRGGQRIVEALRHTLLS